MILDKQDNGSELHNFRCVCDNPYHQIDIYYEKEEEKLYITPLIVGDRNFFKRVKTAFKFLFFYKKGKVISLSETILNKKDVIELKELLKKI